MARTPRRTFGRAPAAEPGIRLGVGKGLEQVERTQAQARLGQPPLLRHAAVKAYENTGAMSHTHTHTHTHKSCPGRRAGRRRQPDLVGCAAIMGNSFVTPVSARTWFCQLGTPSLFRCSSACACAASSCTCWLRLSGGGFQGEKRQRKARSCPISHPQARVEKTPLQSAPTHSRETSAGRAPSARKRCAMLHTML